MIRCLTLSGRKEVLINVEEKAQQPQAFSPTHTQDRCGSLEENRAGVLPRVAPIIGSHCSCGGVKTNLSTASPVSDEFPLIFRWEDFDPVPPCGFFLAYWGQQSIVKTQFWRVTLHVTITRFPKLTEQSKTDRPILPTGHFSVWPESWQ